MPIRIADPPLYIVQAEWQVLPRALRSLIGRGASASSSLPILESHETSASQSSLSTGLLTSGSLLDFVFVVAVTWNDLAVRACIVESSTL